MAQKGDPFRERRQCYATAATPSSSPKPAGPPTTNQRHLIDSSTEPRSVIQPHERMLEPKGPMHTANVGFWVVATAKLPGGSPQMRSFVTLLDPYAAVLAKDPTASFDLSKSRQTSNRLPF